MSDDELCGDGGRGYLLPSCVRCAHWNQNRDAPACAAFPSGVPADIWDGSKRHILPYPGDQGLRFDYLPGADAPGFLRKARNG